MKNGKVYLSRRNLLTLLSKLDRKAAGEETQATLIKRDTNHPVYPQNLEQFTVMAVEDDEYYADRSPGYVHPSDDPSTK